MKPSSHNIDSQDNKPKDVSHQISFCIVCKNSLMQLKKTLIANVLQNENYDNLEMIILDHNSTDGTDVWIKKTFEEYIISGKIVYYKTLESFQFNHSHLKNIAFKLAKGEIVCNIPAEIFLGPKFPTLINNDFKNNSNTYIIQARGTGFPPGANELICVKKSDFLNIHGFDEKMRIYGWDDVDFINRLQHSGKKARFIQNPEYFKGLPSVVKYKMGLDSEIDSIYISQLDTVLTFPIQTLVLFNDRSYKYGTIVNHSLSPFNIESKQELSDFELLDKTWNEGKWLRKNKLKSSLKSENRTPVSFKVEDEIKCKLIFNRQRIDLFKVSNKSLFDFIAHFELDHYNKAVMIENEQRGQRDINRGFFGQTVVFKNFNYHSPIMVF